METAYQPVVLSLLMAKINALKKFGFALSIILKAPILNDISHPTRVKTSNDDAMTLWTYTRVNHKPLYWCPNHFVPLVPYNKKC